MSRGAALLIVTMSVLLLCLLVIFSAHYDQYVFYVGGGKLLDGAVPFRDLMDTKPGLIFYIYGFSTWLFGHTEYAARWLDLFFHLLTLAYFYRILLRETRRQDIALLSVFVYIVFYIGGGPFATGQAESFALLPNLILFDVTLREFKNTTRSYRYGILAGLAGVILFLLKYTLVLGLAVPLLLVVADKPKKHLLFGFVTLMTFLTGIGLWVGFLAMTGALPNAVENFRWLTAYSQMNPPSDLYTIKEQLLRIFVEHFVQVFSLTFIALAAIGAFIAMRRKEKQEPSYFRGYLLLQFLIAVSTILVEQKFLYYQYTRAFWCAAPFVAYGLIEVREQVRVQKRVVAIIAVPILWLGLLFYSPLTDITGILVEAGGIPLPWNLTPLREGLNDETIQKEYRFAAEAIKPLLSENDKVFIFGQHPGLYFHLDRTSPSFINASGFITASWAPEVWKDQMMNELRREAPTIVIIEFNDAVPLINASIDDSWEHFQRWTEFREWVYRHYRQVMQVNRFRVFRRRS